jgi:hypothetical protein
MIGRHGPPAAVSLQRVVLPVSVVLIVTAVGMGFYNWRVTGHPLLFPYVLHERTYDIAPLFIWQHPRPVPIYRHEALRDFYTGWALDWYNATRSLSGLIAVSFVKLRNPWILFQGLSPLRLVLTIPLLVLPWCFGNPWRRFLLIAVTISIIGLLLITWPGARFIAPIMGAVIVLFVEAFRVLRIINLRTVPFGKLIVWSLVLVALLSFFYDFIGRVKDTTLRWSFERARIRRQLEYSNSRHLIIVRYGPEHLLHQEWVYNEADIDVARVVWAREMTPDEDKKLIEYFKDRKIWLLDIGNDEWPPKLMEYYTRAAG